jgi:SPP1 gp7 family putative phage head morphogenesis protein
VGLHNRYHSIIDENSLIELADSLNEFDNLSPLFSSMMSVLYNQKGANLNINIIASDEVQSFMSAHAATLDSSFEKTPMSDAMRARLQRSNFIFSGMKTFHELNEAFPSLLDENGDRKPFERFLNDVQSINKTYNKNYLRAEYNFVHASAQMAAKWDEFSQDGDRYNLQYRTAGDGNVRPEHAALNGVTLPPSDPFWSEFYPPNGWNCRCTVVQVRKNKYPVTDHAEAIERGNEALQRDSRGIFRFNPGIEGKSVPDYNPYTIRRCRDCDKSKLMLARFVPESDLCAACQLVRSCESLRAEVIKIGNGRIEVSNLVNRNDSDFNKIMDVAKHFANTGEEVIITPKKSRPSKFQYDCIYGDLKDTIYYGKCPDLKVGDKWYEHEGFVSDKPKRAFNNMLNHGLKQSDRIIIDRPNITERFMLRSILNRISLGANISEVLLRNSDGSITPLYKKTDG